MIKQASRAFVLVILMTGLVRSQTSLPLGVYKGVNLWATEVGDFDQDGLPDGMFLTANDLHVELNYGYGNLPYALTYPGEGGAQLKALDLDGDGDLDFLVLRSMNSSGNTSSISVLRNSLGLLSGSLITVRGRVIPQLTDIDNDGMADLLGDGQWNRASAPGVFAATPQPITFAPHLAPSGTVISYAATYYPGDFDGDGDIDLISYRQESGTSAGTFSFADLYVNDGNGLFSYQMSEPVSFPSIQVPSAEIIVRDFNFDGIDDFMVEEQFHGHLVIHLGDTSGHFLRGLIELPGLGHFEALADLDGDGDRDIIVRRPAATVPLPPTGAPPSLNVLENIGYDLFVEPISSVLPFLGYQLRVADFDLDGRDDILYGGAFGGLGYGVVLGAMTSTTGATIRDIVGLAGNAQSVASPSPFPVPLTFIVQDEFNVGVPGYSVTIEALGGLQAPTSAITDAAGLVSIPVVSGTEVGVGRLKVSGPNAASRYFRFDVTQSRFIREISGFDQGGNLGGNFPAPLHLRVEDLLGVPIPGATVVIERRFGTTSAPVLGSPFITDGSGEISVPISTGNGPLQGNPGDLGDLGITISSPSALTTTASLFTRRLFQTYQPNGAGIWDRRVRYHHEHIWVPLIMMADLPQAAPVSTIFGPLYTSFASPQPTLYLLDGIGLTGPPVPGVITAPQGNAAGHVFELVFPWNLLPPQTQVVFQVLTYDNAYAFPIKVGLSEPVTVTF